MKKITGQVERVGFAPCGEITSTYVLKLTGDVHIYHADITNGSNERFIYALTKETDQVHFEADEQGKIVRQSFENLHLSIK